MWTLPGAQAVTYYVSTTGDDQSQGLTAGTAFATLAKALEPVDVDVISVGAGVYEEDSLLVSTTVRGMKTTDWLASPCDRTGCLTCFFAAGHRVSQQAVRPSGASLHRPASPDIR